MLTKDLTGHLLDCWVQKAIVPTEKVYFNSDGWTGRWHVKAPAYSTDWAEGGPIIDREGISLVRYLEAGIPVWHAHLRHYIYKGPTPLIAAMRAYVASKFGDEVPDNGDTTGSGNE